MVKLLAEQSMKYASAYKNNQTFTVTVADIRQFCGILLLSGYHALPEESRYWSCQPYLGVGLTLVSDARSSKRFQTIKHYLPLSDNRQLEEGNKVAKVKPPCTDQKSTKMLQASVCTVRDWVLALLQLYPIGSSVARSLTLIWSPKYSRPNLVVVPKDLCQSPCSTMDISTSVHHVIRGAAVFARRTLA